MRKNLQYFKFQKIDVFKSHGPVRKHLHFNLIKKCTAKYFNTQNVDFYILTPKMFPVQIFWNFPDTIWNSSSAYQFVVNS